MAESLWIDAGPAASLGPGESRLLRHDGRQYLLLRTQEGELFACDNACPHEGYPLLQGYTEGCLLTCAWHNFKFDLRDGRCVVGEEDLRVHPLRESEGRLELELSPPGGEAHEARLWKSLESALDEQRLGQAARDTERLLAAGVAPGRVAAFAAEFDARRAPWGSSHALPVAADLLHWLEDPSRDPLLPLLQALESAAESGHRRVPHPPSPATDGPREEAALRHELLGAVESERMEEAEALLRGAAARGVDPATLEAWLLEACCAHFLDFGHELIYLEKLPGLRPHCTTETYLEIQVGLLRGIVYGTREDTLPPMAAMRRQLDESAPRFDTWMRAQRNESTLESTDRESLWSWVLDGRGGELASGLAGLLEAGANRHELARELVLAAATRVLRFDPAIELDHGIRENWLHVTHTLTFASAVRRVLRENESPHCLALLFHAAHFIQHKKPLDREALPGRELDGRSASPASADGVSLEEEIALDELRSAVLAGDRDRALAGLGARLRARGVDRELEHWVEDLALEHRAVRPIRAAHVLKTLWVGLEETRSLRGDPRAELPLSAAVAFACARTDERGMLRIAREAAEFVREGRPPRRLTS